MRFFTDNRNRALFGGLLFCAACLEIIFFSYAMEELYSPLFPTLIDLLVAAGVTVLATFSDIHNRANCIFVSAGCFVLSMFASYATEMFGSGAVDGMFAIFTASFWGAFLKYAVISFVTSFGCAVAGKEQRNTGDLIMPWLLALLFAGLSFVWDKTVVQSLFMGASAMLAGFLSQKVLGGAIKPGLLWNAVLTAVFVLAIWMFGAYRDGELLTMESASAVDMIIVFTGLIMTYMKKRFGVYLYGFFGLHLALGYLGTFISGEIEVWCLFGMVPCLLLFLAAMTVLRYCPAVYVDYETKEFTDKQGTEDKMYDE